MYVKGTQKEVINYTGLRNSAKASERKWCPKSSFKKGNL